MATTGLEVWDHSIQTTNIWLDEIMEETGLDRQGAWHALGAVLRALRDRLPPELALHLAAQLPLLLRGAFCEQWHLGGTPPDGRALDDFLAGVERHLGRGRAGPAAAITPAVFRAVAHHVEPGQMQKVMGALPAGIRVPLAEAAAA